MEAIKRGMELQAPFAEAKEAVPDYSAGKDYPGCDNRVHEVMKIAAERCHSFHLRYWGAVYTNDEARFYELMEDIRNNVLKVLAPMSLAYDRFNHDENHPWKKSTFKALNYWPRLARCYTALLREHNKELFEQEQKKQRRLVVESVVLENPCLVVRIKNLKQRQQLKENAKRRLQGNQMRYQAARLRETKRPKPNSATYVQR